VTFPVSSGGRKVDGDDLWRKRETDRRANTLTALGNGLVGEAHDRELRQTRGKLDLHFDGPGLEPEIRDGRNCGGHGRNTELKNTFPLTRPYPASPSRFAIASALREPRSVATSPRMITGRQIKRFFDKAWVEWGMFALGILLIIAGIVISPIPGPGGIFLIAPGVALILKTSMWAKRRYVKMKRWQPKAGRWTDLALRRQSARRREAIRKAERQQRRQLQERRSD
jgi:hypothetical protein